MARITEDMVRKRAEHNECEITTLEELSLHQQDIEKIEHLEKWCKRLKILYLQSNLISKIENVGRLKELEYLNLALNNVTKIENLQKCESLQKLDLTVNFVGDLLSIASLKDNVHLQELFLTGNPCTDYNGYRDFVIATLPQLKWLDGKEILKSDRIIALQWLPELKDSIAQQQKQYELKLLKEKEEEERLKTEGDTRNDESVPHTPESRTALHKELLEKRQEGKETENKGRNPNPPKRERRLEKDGRFLNVNEGRYEFTLEENDEEQCFIVDVSCPKYMDTSLIDCDVQPSYIRVTIKDKVLQLVLPEEVSPDASSAKRSQTTGHLLVRMPKANPCLRQRTKPSAVTTVKKTSKSSERPETLKELDSNGHQYLEVSENMFKIIKDDESTPPYCASDPPLVKTGDNTMMNNQVPPSEDFIDNPDVPPLI